MDSLTVFSCFDGMSCGQIALNRAGFKIKEYYASEIDKYAIQVTQKNYPNTIQLGDVTLVDGHALPKIDLFIGGSPCQSFSFAGKRKGMSTTCSIEIFTLDHYLQLKKDGFKFAGQSFLFWEYMRLLNECRSKNPDIKFLLENVEMGKRWETILSRAIGFNGHHINAALLSAQNRERIYWTNINEKKAGLFEHSVSVIPQPKDKKILLMDILQQEVNQKYFMSKKVVDRIIKTNPANPEKSYCLSTKNNAQGNSSIRSTTIIDETVCAALRGRYAANTGATVQMLEIKTDGKSNCLTSVNEDNLIVHNLMPRSSKTKKGGTGPLSRNDGKTYCLDTGQTNAIEFKSNLRRLTPVECERLQTVPDNYTEGVSDTQRYKMLGNGWNIDVIAYILSFLNLKQ